VFGFERRGCLCGRLFEEIKKKQVRAGLDCECICVYLSDLIAARKRRALTAVVAAKKAGWTSQSRFRFSQGGVFQLSAWARKRFLFVSKSTEGQQG
jgi:hypothetical protein